MHRMASPSGIQHQRYWESIRFLLKSAKRHWWNLPNHWGTFWLLQPFWLLLWLHHSWPTANRWPPFAESSPYGAPQTNFDHMNCKPEDWRNVSVGKSETSKSSDRSSEDYHARPLGVHYRKRTVAACRHGAVLNFSSLQLRTYSVARWRRWANRFWMQNQGSYEFVCNRQQTTQAKQTKSHWSLQQLPPFLASPGLIFALIAEELTCRRAGN